MKLFKKIAAAVLALSMAVAMAACADTSWVYQYGDKTVSSGLYLSFVMNSYAEATSLATDTETALLKQTIEEKDAKVWITDNAKALTAQYIAIEKKFDEMGLSLTESDMNEINQSVKTEWPQNSAVYEKNGVGEQTYRQLVTGRKKADMVFRKYYSKDGTEPITDDNLLVHYKENFASVNMFGIEKVQNLEDSEAADTAANDKLNEEYKVLAESYAEQFNSGDKTMGELYDEYVHKDAETTHDDANAEDVILKDEETRRLIKKDSTSPSEEVVKSIYADMKPDKKAMVISDDRAYYIVVRYDVTDKETDFGEMRDQLLYDLKNEEFTTLTEKWAAELTPSATNDASVKRYNPKKIDLNVEAEQ